MIVPNIIVEQVNLQEKLGVRLVQLPLTVLASDNPEIPERSIEEFEYHLITWVDGLR